MHKSSKEDLLDKTFQIGYYRSAAKSIRKAIEKSTPREDYKLRATEINTAIKKLKENLITYIIEKSISETWSREETLDGILMTTYASYVVMIENRNAIWAYDYMTFSRRIGELWEPFCALAWDYPVNDRILLLNPPSFSEVKQNMIDELDQFSEKLKMNPEDKEILMSHYEKVWQLVTSGDIKLDLDLHFSNEKIKYNVDFKSGFSSNEKGNTNRLLLVGSIYRMMNQGHKCEIYVRAEEESNNHYLQTLKNSKLWEVFCGDESYDRIKEHTGFDIKDWISRNITWHDDFDSATLSHLNSNGLVDYLKW